jgi:hypothetical protein
MRNRYINVISDMSWGRGEIVAHRRAFWPRPGARHPAPARLDWLVLETGLACRIRIYDVAQQKCILRSHDRIVDGGHGQPEILQRLGNFDAGRIRDIEDVLLRIWNLVARKQPQDSGISHCRYDKE